MSDTELFAAWIMPSKVINSFDMACGDYKLHVTWNGHESNREEPEPAPTAADIPTRPMHSWFVAVTGIRAQSRESPTGYGFLPPYHPALSHTFCPFSWKRLGSVYNLLFSKQTKQTNINRRKKKKAIKFCKMRPTTSAGKLYLNNEKGYHAPK